jgi:hypothetical protein
MPQRTVKPSRREGRWKRLPREGASNGQSVTGFNRQNAFAWRFILVKGKPMKKAAVVLSAAAVIAMTTVSIPTPVEARGDWGWGPGIAGGLVAGALIGGLVPGIIAE